jgi:drug/metabolite transporter (DMT)-like permease
MRLFLLTTLTMVAFAANSVLNRMALADGAIGPLAFALIRLSSGAALLLVLIWWTQRPVKIPLKRRMGGAGSLALYMIGFSLAYLSLDAGVGALILFGGVQITMFLGAVLMGEAITPRRYVGALLSFAGLVYLLWPSGNAIQIDGLGAALMAAAAIGWGLYSLLGRQARDALAETGMNFLWASPICALVFLIWPEGATAYGIALAVLSGVVTSGLGYALWYSILPALGASRAAVAQLTVPIIAVLGGVALLGEGLSVKLALATCVVLGGVALSLSGQSPLKGRSG